MFFFLCMVVGPTFSGPWFFLVIKPVGVALMLLCFPARAPGPLGESIAIVYVCGLLWTTVIWGMAWAHAGLTFQGWGLAIGGGVVGMIVGAAVFFVCTTVCGVDPGDMSVLGRVQAGLVSSILHFLEIRQSAYNDRREQGRKKALHRMLP
ncbi:hypothetical protein C8R45DRAFT_210986 [Mycena sanguinolenta]|nr:hypothetical protein C8R45DRAFT_210986 [Mycena sanguinolenta]